MTAYKANTSDSLSVPVDAIYNFLPKTYQVNYSVEKKVLNALLMDEFKEAKNPEARVLLDIRDLVLDDEEEGLTNSEMQKKPRRNNGTKTEGGEHGDDAPLGADKITTVDMINSLSFPNSKVSTSAKEQLLHDVFLNFALSREVISYIEQSQINLIFKVLGNTNSTDIEKFFSFKTLILIAVTFMDDYGNYIFSKLEAYVKQNAGNNSDADPDVKSYLIVGYFTMFLMFNEGSSHVSDIESLVDYWLNILTSINDLKKEATVAVAIINGLSILLSIDNDAHELNESIETLIPSLILYLSSEPRIAIVAGSLISQCFQDFTFFKDEDDQDLPYYDKHEIKELFESNLRESSKSISKDDRKKLHTSFRNMLSTLENNWDLSARKDFQESGEKSEKLASIVLSGRRKLNLHFYSWDHITRLTHLRWLFGSGLTSFLFDNTEYISLLQENRNKFSNSANSDDGVIYNEYADTENDEPHQKISNVNGKTDKKKVDIAIQKARLAKLALNSGTSDAD